MRLSAFLFQRPSVPAVLTFCGWACSYRLVCTLIRSIGPHPCTQGAQVMRVHALLYRWISLCLHLLLHLYVFSSHLASSRIIFPPHLAPRRIGCAESFTLRRALEGQRTEPGDISAAWQALERAGTWVKHSFGCLVGPLIGVPFSIAKHCHAIVTRLPTPFRPCWTTMCVAWSIAGVNVSIRDGWMCMSLYSIPRYVRFHP